MKAAPLAGSWRALPAAAALAIAVGAPLTGVLAALLVGSWTGERATVALVAQASPAPARPSPASRSAGQIGRTGLASLPATAAGTVSATLGEDDPAYRVSAAAGGLTAVNPAQRLRASFGRAGVSVTTGATSVGWSLRALGYGAALAPVGEVTPRASADRAIYAHAGLSERYANGPLGLEQLFTVAAPPAAAPRTGPLTLALALSGDAKPALLADGRGVALAHAGGPALSFADLNASDASGRALRSWMTLAGDRVLVHVDAEGARYPLQIDPLVRQGEKLTASSLSGPYGYVGMSVALSADGDTALVGAPADGEYTGSAFVFTRTGSTWTQQARLNGAGTAGEAWFGESVALSANGDEALIGAPSDDGAVGAAWVFARSGSTWTEQGAKLTGAGESGAGFFGKSVALSANGGEALIGGYNDDEHAGAAWAFTRSGSSWRQQGAKLTGSGQLGFFGWSVALSADGDSALVGEWGLGGGVGAAWAFTRSGSTWSRQSPALGAGVEGFPWFGYSVALSADGDTAVVGAPHADAYAGAAWVFARSGSSWVQQGAPLTGGGEAGEGELGYSAAVSADGGEALLGGRVDNQFHGAAWAFSRSGASWSQDGEKLTGGEETADREEFGWSVALSAGANTALVGSPCDNACAGSSSVFVKPSEPPEYGRCEKVVAGTGEYASAACATAGGAGDYEWRPGAVEDGLATTLRSGSPTLATTGGWKLVCAGESGGARLIGPHELGEATLALSGCAHAGEQCASKGAGAGEVVSSTLDGTLGVVGAGSNPAKEEIGLDLHPAAGETVMQFGCGATAVSLRGSAIATLSAGRMAQTSVLKLQAGKGRQRPEAFAGEARDVLEASFDGGPYEQAGLTLQMSQTGEEALEVDAEF